MPELAGLYLHIPFCAKKCAYCDFYSSFAADRLIDEYLAALCAEMNRWGGIYDRPVDSVYIGGGTPSLLGDRIVPLMDAVRKSFHITPDAEITAEVNPSSAAEGFLNAAYRAGINRLSIGVQSGDDDELALLGRTHTAADAAHTVNVARSVGFRNISLDLMLCLPGSSTLSLEKSLNFLTGLHPEHISTYMLKIEPNTLFSLRKTAVPDDDEQARQYLFVCSYLENHGFGHYEISNFSRSGKYSRHNLKYWTLAEYLGIGPSAHSFLDGKRFYYPRNIKAFIRSPQTVDDGAGGGIEEQIMLGLRLRHGIDFEQTGMRYGCKPTSLLPRELNKLVSANLGRFENGRFSLTDSGMLVSNSIITDIMEIAYEDI